MFFSYNILVIILKITVNDAIKNTDAKLLYGDAKTIIINPFVNTKNAKENGTFFGIKDNYKYYVDALKKGTKVLVLPRCCNVNIKGYNDVCILICDDVLKCMQDLARYKRSLFKGKVIGITGSVGKTTTKEYVSSVLLNKYKVLKTINNQNGQIGVALTILSLKDEEVIVLEMGISKPGEMDVISSIAKPSIVIITNVFSSHIANFKDREELLNEKLKIINENTNNVIINADNDLLISKLNNYNNLITYSIYNNSLYQATNVNSGIITTFDCNNNKKICIKGPRNIVYDALPAIVIAKLFNVDEDKIKNALYSVKNEKHRLEVIKTSNYTIIDDTYNASLESMINAIQFLSKYDGRKILVLGDILEIGKNYKYVYKLIANEINKYIFSYLITIGTKSKYICKCVNNIKYRHFKDVYKCKNYILKLIKPNDIVLIKGSHAINLDYLVNVDSHHIN